MTLTHILVFGGLAFLLGLLARYRGRINLLLGVSALAVYILQPALPLRGMDFWLPTVTLALAALSWLVTAPSEMRSLRTQWPAVLILTSIVLLLGLTRYLDISLPLVDFHPPQLPQIAIALVTVVVLGLVLARLPAWVFPAWMALLLVLFIILKTPALLLLASRGLRLLTGQSPDLASAFDLRWLGFSYIAFRIIHTLRDRQSGRLPPVSLAEYVTYIIFFPALTAGPIDRLERFIKDLRGSQLTSANGILSSGQRLMVGLFKKFILADGLALISLNVLNADQVRSSGWMWVLLYAYSFQIYFDFSGYTDIAIGIGQLLGIRLPENFNSPYLKPNLTQFWNNWHMTLTQWFRAYFFNPLTRFLRSKKMSIPLIILFTQVATMVLIGLWHGVTWNFIIWGLWHGAGLFIHNRWSEWVRPCLITWAVTRARQALLNAGGILLTFHFVALGWVFFALPTFSLSWNVLLKLFGAG